MARRSKHLIASLVIGGIVAGFAAWYFQNRSPAQLAPGVTTTTVRDGAVSYQVVNVDLAHSDVHLVWRRDDTGARLARLPDAADYVRRRTGRQAVFATNAGIFDPARTP